jgi:hypothetical protein
MDTEIPAAQLKVGTVISTGQIIDLILGQSSKVCVFMTKDNNLRWQYDGDLPASLLPIVTEFNALMTEIVIAHLG